MKLVVGLGHWSSCRVTSAPNSFDFKRYRLNPTLWCPFIYVLFISAFNWLLWQSQPCSQLPDFPSVFLWDCHIRLKERLWLIRAVAVGSHKGSCGFCNSLYFPLQKPLPASNQLPSIKGQKKKKKGAVKRLIWSWVKIVICGILENVFAGGMKASCYSLLTGVTKKQPLCLQQNCNA